MVLMFYSIDLKVILWPCLGVLFLFIYYFDISGDWRKWNIHRRIKHICACHFSFCPNFSNTFFLSALTVILSEWTVSNRDLTLSKAQWSQTFCMHHITRQTWCPFLTFYMSNYLPVVYTQHKNYLFFHLCSSEIHHDPCVLFIFMLNN